MKTEEADRLLAALIFYFVFSEGDLIFQLVSLRISIWRRPSSLPAFVEEVKSKLEILETLSCFRRRSARR